MVLELVEVTVSEARALKRHAAVHGKSDCRAIWGGRVFPVKAAWRSNVVTEKRRSRGGPAALMGARGVWAFRKSDQTS